MLHSLNKRVALYDWFRKDLCDQTSSMLLAIDCIAIPCFMLRFLAKIVRAITITIGCNCGCIVFGRVLASSSRFQSQCLSWILCVPYV